MSIRARYGVLACLLLTIGLVTAGLPGCPPVSTPLLLTDNASVTVPENATVGFQMKLSSAPSANVTVTVSRSSGDTDITVQSGASLTFTTSNWSAYQAVTLVAAHDADTTNGTATIRCGASGLTSVDVTATEQDDDTGSGNEGETVQEGENIIEGEGEEEAVVEGEPPTEGEPETQTVTLSGGVPLVMVWVPAGTFMMGANGEGEQDSWSGEYPQHQETLSQGFWMGKYELTQGQWKAVMNSNPSYFQGANAGNVNTDNRPVEQVSWSDIQTFIATLNTYITNSSQGSATMRLPSEAEWEYACRAGTPTRFYWGDDPDYTEIGNYAWYAGNNTPFGTKDVGGKTGNDFGLYDISGNIWEWVEDDWHYYSDPGAPMDATAWVDTPRGSYRVLRGGSWDISGHNCRSALRVYNGPSFTDGSIGFRVAR